MEPLLAAVLDGYVRDWLDLIIRSLHVIAAIGWIGSSFYFVLLDQSLKRPATYQDEQDGVGGELWEIHGGGFYHVKKYKVAPPALPEHLAWFKWEAYTTWLSGFALLVALYWLDARAYMIDPSVADIGPWAAVGISAGLIAGAWLYYDVLCRLLRGRERTLMLFLVAGIAVAAWGTGELFSPRAAWLQVGAMLGTVMAGSVFFNIIPAHWELVRAKQAGRDPDPAPGIEAKRRSVHNNYFTLPVLVTMLAGHFTFMTTHEHAWVLLLCLMAIGAFIRHFYNLRHGGRTRWWMPAVVVLALAVMFVLLRPEGWGSGEGDDDTSVKGAPAGAVEGRAVFLDNCGSCHTLADAGTDGAIGPDLDAATPDEATVRDRVRNGMGSMPAFDAELDDAEIDAVAGYVAGAAGD